MIIFEWGLILGLWGVASNPSPYFGALGLVFSAGMGCMILLGGGMTFLCLVLFLVYLGGMMVVFAYSSALVAESYPEAWGGGAVLYLVIYMILGGVWWVAFFKEGGVNFKEGGVNFKVGESVFCDWMGVSMLFEGGGWILLLSGWALLLTLFVVMETVVGRYFGVLRNVV
uniref:NADH-ubiquinone oxidoreductase chain 6 n=1 Tax=Pristimantis fenestratus TaxID=448655 RepID=A0A0S2A2U7_9NEOB|nr:NADH dehydrogenase subunit 6 [Pristimantis fenestratus]